jgi:hypothetical protein
MTWVVAVLTSEFFWGVIVGLVLAAIGAWLQAVLTARQFQKAQKNQIKNLCIDTINNIKAIVDDMADHRQKSNVIHSDYLSLLDIEFNVSGRNRENIIHLPNPLRDNVRKFITDCAIRRGEIGGYLAQFSNSMTLANQLQTQGQAFQTQRQQAQAQAQAQLALANQALNQLATRVKDSADLVNNLKQVR